MAVVLNITLIFFYIFSFMIYNSEKKTMGLGFCCDSLFILIFAIFDPIVTLANYGSGASVIY